MKTERQIEIDELCKLKMIEIIANHIIFFKDIHKQQIGVLATDTIADIQRYPHQEGFRDIKEIEEDIDLLRTWAEEGEEDEK